jgi:S-(hydroxymethyl)glutathione dehydrogenase/alcohol dehydrogenase
MKSAIFYKPDPIIPVEDIDLLPPQKGEVLVKLSAAGVCHSDHHFMTGHFTPTRAPFVMGHEGAGIISEIGQDVKGVKPGDKVIFSMDSMCGKCMNCILGKPTMCLTYPRTFAMPDGSTRFRKGKQEIYHMVGTFSEYTVVPEDQVILVPDNTPLDKACIIGCAVITGVGAVINRAKVKVGETTAVFGCGGVGLNVIQGCNLAGARQIIAIDNFDSKLKSACEMGATHTINPTKENVIEKIMDITSGGVDYAFEVVGSAKLIELAFSAIKRGGSTIIVGVPSAKSKISIDAMDLLVDKAIIGSFHGNANPKFDFLWILDLYHSGKLKLDQLITGYRPLNEINQAFDDLLNGKAIRTILTFD